MHFQGTLFDWINGPHYLVAAGYPKLIPTFAASFSTLTQKWNELLPGSALFIFLVHTMFGILTILYKLRLPLILSILIFLSLGRFIWNFYMDGYFALYAGLTGYFFSSFCNNKSINDFCVFILSLAILINIKNEGMLFLLIMIFTFIIFINKFKDFLLENTKISFTYSLAFIPFIIWNLWNYKLNITRGGFSNDNFFTIALERINNHLPYILKEIILVKHNFYYLLTIIVISLIITLYLRYKSVKMSYEIIPIFIIIILYIVGIFSIYLTTTYGGGGFEGLKLHIDQSMNRVMFSVMILGFILILFLISDIKNKLSLN